jgi:hypothetical protein
MKRNESEGGMSQSALSGMPGHEHDAIRGFGIWLAIVWFCFGSFGWLAKRNDVQYSVWQWKVMMLLCYN